MFIRKYDIEDVYCNNGTGDYIIAYTRGEDYNTHVIILFTSVENLKIRFFF